MISRLRGMLSLIHSLRLDRYREKSNFSFKKELDNYNTSELVPASTSTISNKQLSSNWLSIYRKQ